MYPQKFKLKIKVCTPVHIGASTALEPTEFVICDEKNIAENAEKASDFIICECGYKNPIGTDLCLGCGSELIEEKPKEKISSESSKAAYLYTFTPKQLLKSVSRQELLNITKKNDLKILQVFLKNNAAKIVKNAHKRALVSSEIFEKYSEKCGEVDVNDKDFNKFALEKNISTAADDLAYIPGSSLKGAVRTALMSWQNGRRNLTYADLQPRYGEANAKKINAEEILYNYEKTTDDPFKKLKISDTVSAPFLTHIGTANNVKRNIDVQSKGIPVDIEVIPSGTEFTAELTLCDSFSPGGMSEIATACTKFYLHRLTTEKNKMVNIHHVSTKVFDNIETALQKPNTFLLRLGKHCGAENVTIEGLRHIKIRNADEYRESATTYWLYNDGDGNLPLGWCVVEYTECL